MLKLTTLGGLSIQCQGEPVTELSPRKTEALLVYLACLGQPKAREVLAELFWEERAQEAAMTNLRGALSNLRRHLGPYLEITRDTASLKPEARVWLDCALLEEQLAGRQGEAVTLDTVEPVEEAVSLYQGDFLEGLYLRGCRGFEDWVVLQRE
jgi:DNA-binding SARP family transcriptional activator